LVADNNTLLHEMIHQLLFGRGEPAGHNSAGWRRETGWAPALLVARSSVAASIGSRWSFLVVGA
jgi:hypothetical protein